jgi:hypothetical protein
LNETSRSEIMAAAPHLDASVEDVFVVAASDKKAYGSPMIIGNLNITYGQCAGVGANKASRQIGKRQD